MPSSRLEATPAAARRGALDTLAAIGGALLLALALLMSLALVLDVVGRFGAGRPFFNPESLDSLTAYAGLGFALASLLALPAALAAPFRRTGDPPRRSRSALALVPGGLAGLIVGFAALAALAVEVGAARAATLAYVQSAGLFTSFVFPALPISLTLAALFAGARTPEATAAAAAPFVLVASCGLMAELSILGMLAATVLPLLAAAVAIACLYAAAPARAVTPWLAGIALALGMTLLVGTGFVTPTEAIGLIALFGVPIALLVRVLALRQPLGTILRQAATEMSAIAVIGAAAVTAGAALAFAARSEAIAGAIGTGPAILIGGAAVYVVASYLLTPLLALGLLIPFALPTLRAAQIEPVLGFAILILLGLAAVVARSARRADAAAPAGLPPAAAWIAAAVFAGLASAVALLPGLALGPARALLS